MIMSTARVAEQAKEEPITCAVDVWGLGATLLECWTGQPPYGNLKNAQILYKMLHRCGPSLECKDRDMPYAIREIVEACLDFEPSQRPTAAEMLQQLAAVRAVCCSSDPFCFVLAWWACNAVCQRRHMTCWFVKVICMTCICVWWRNIAD